MLLSVCKRFPNVEKAPRPIALLGQQFQIQNLTALKPLQQLEFMILNISTVR